MITIGGFGLRGRTTYFFLMLDNTINVRCGCFAGSLDKWRKQVKSTRSVKVADAYLTAADAVVMQFDYLGGSKDD